MRHIYALIAVILLAGCIGQTSKVYVCPNGKEVSDKIMCAEEEAPSADPQMWFNSLMESDKKPAEGTATSTTETSTTTTETPSTTTSESTSSTSSTSTTTTTSSTTTTTIIICNKSSDCGTARNSTRCYQSNVAMYQEYPECLNPGTPRAKCKITSDLTIADKCDTNWMCDPKTVKCVKK